MWRHTMLEPGPSVTGSGACRVSSSSLTGLSPRCWLSAFGCSVSEIFWRFIVC